MFAVFMLGVYALSVLGFVDCFYFGVLYVFEL